MILTKCNNNNPTYEYACGYEFVSTILIIITTFEGLASIPQTTNGDCYHDNPWLTLRE